MQGNFIHRQSGIPQHHPRIFEPKQGQVLLGGISRQPLELMGKIVVGNIVFAAKLRYFDGFVIVDIQILLNGKNTALAGIGQTVGSQFRMKPA